MNKIIGIAVSAAAAAGLYSCATEKDTPSNADERLYFDSWIQTHCPGAEKVGIGTYILADEAGNPEKPVTDSQFVYVSYITSGLDGTITGYSEAETARKLGEYDSKKTYYFGPRVWTKASGYMYAGVNDMLSGMSVDGFRKAVIPGWLMSYQWYGSEQEFLDNVSGTNTIYDVKIVDAFSDSGKWQIDSIGRFLQKSREDFGDSFGYLDIYDIIQEKDTVHSKADSVSYGFYFINIDKGQPLDTKDSNGDEMDIPNGSHFFTTSGTTDTTIFINYVGRLLNGLVFDTNVERVAQVNGLSGGTYEPMEIQWADSYSELKMGTGDDASSMISGFAQTLWQMHPFGRALGIFYSTHGYGASGSGNSIPAYSPLLFEIEIVKDPEAEEE